MDVTEVLQFVDDLVFGRTGKHLDDLQKAVVEGTWQRRTYDDIASKCHVTKNHVGDVGYQLWQLLSEQLEEDINKLNFRSTVERLHIQSSQNICVGTNNNFHFGSQTLDLPAQHDRSQILSKSSYHDLTLAPQIIHFSDRENELENQF
jgi:uncharacterized FAD-dependent dehydrogenase